MRYLTTTLAALLLGTCMTAEATVVNRPERQVEEWYQTYIGRSASAAELRHWGLQLRRSVRPSVVLAGILGTPDYYVKHGRTPSGFVIGLHLDVAGRYPTARELQNAALLLSRGASRAEIARLMLQANPTLLANPVVTPLMPVQPAWGWTCLGPIPNVTLP